MGKSTINHIMFNSYVSSPEGKRSWVVCVSENGIWKTPAYHVTTEHDDKPLDSGDSLFSAQSQVVAVGC